MSAACRRARGWRCRRASPAFRTRCIPGRRGASRKRDSTSPAITPVPRGGHFAALEAPDLLVADLREWGRSG
ncbi:Epoxide hydrolase [Roseomonas mucosa]|uniref:Epoxide hydrolase n=1 Tax=Roseomonas mucosa TaxID=207340 RepID=A0A4Y1MYM2_9PROT|nr:Epoxide hydrolase [Roseomonas mucosa]QDD94741.1 Epoxide hydrolase [Roseomonas mucosa]QET92746.1 hypothetical protein FOB66_07855 [Roseomonas mucosa]UZO92142.1 Epoxide hydrolase [Roseomonas mucosa]